MFGVFFKQKMHKVTQWCTQNFSFSGRFTRLVWYVCTHMYPGSKKKYYQKKLEEPIKLGPTVPIDALIASVI